MEITTQELNIAAAYIRVSTEDQTEYSPDSQIKLIREYAKRNGYIVPDEYIFEDAGISGRTAKKRPDFMRMISLAKEKPRLFNAIFVWKFSRFARNQEESIVYKSLLKKSNNIDVISISEPVSDEVFGSLIERIIEWMDQFYSIRLSGEVKRGMCEKVSRGEPVVHASFGYDMKNKRYYPNENAEIVRNIFSSYLTGEGMRSIAQRLNGAGVLTTRGNAIDNRYIEYILNNPVYIGKIRWSKDGRTASLRDYDNPNIIIADGLHEPIIDMNTWNAVQDKLAQTKKQYGKYVRRNQSIDWMLKGMCRCSSCGSTLCLLSTATPSMQCHKYARGQCAVSHSMSISKANTLVLNGLKEAAETGIFKLVPETTSEKDSDGPNWTRLIKAEERKLERIKEAFYSGVDTVEEYKTNKEAIQSNIIKLKEQLQKRSAKMTAIDISEMRKKVSGVIATIEAPDISESAKNKALRTIVSKVIFSKSTDSLDIFFLL